MSRFARICFICIAFLVADFGGFAGAVQAQDAPAGQRVFYTGHSFHIFVPPRVEQYAKAAGIQGHVTAGTQGIGGSRVIQHWDLKDGDNKARQTLSDGKVDVFTMSPHLAVPDAGIENFIGLGLKNNPQLRFLVQASWVPFDIVAPTYKIDDKVKRDDTDLDALQASTDIWRTKLEAQVDELNKKHGKAAASIVPVGDAVVTLRRLVKKGEVPGLAKQADLFTDGIGHGKGHIMALAACCNFVAMYGVNPSGLKVTEGGVTAEQQAILQRIAWETVSKYERAGVKK